MHCGWMSGIKLTRKMTYYRGENGGSAIVLIYKNRFYKAGCGMRE